MNLQAAFKTLLVVLAIGAVTGYGEWNKVHGGTPAERTARSLASCIKAGKMAAYQANPHMMGRSQAASDKKVEAACQAEQVKSASSELPAYLSQAK